MSKMRIAIFGASGYSGAELVRVLAAHPRAEIAYLGGDSSAGQSMASLYPALRSLRLPMLEKLEPAELKDKVSYAFLALPHTASLAFVPALLEAGIKVIDLSADFRLSDAKNYEFWYKHAHSATGILAEAVYGLPELYADKIKAARLVANPGCYTTTSILALYPLAKAGLIKPGSIIVDAKSGVSGAGRKLQQSTAFSEVYDNFSTYNVGGGHRHIAEIEQEIGKAMGAETRVTFTPHLLPLSRGILATCYVEPTKPLTQEEAIGIYTKAYVSAPFTHVYPGGELPSIRSVRGTNECHIGLRIDSRTGRVIIVSCTDNLGKGAAFQAIQNMNLMAGFGQDEGLGLRALAL